MKLYLARHGDAVSPREHPERPLSAVGLTEVNLMASQLEVRRESVSRVFHSGKLRAEQTAKILAGAMAPSANMSVLKGLLPMDSVMPIGDMAELWDEDTLLVGHLPFMGLLTGYLVNGREDRGVTDFHTGTVACLERTQPRLWKLLWSLTP